MSDSQIPKSIEIWMCPECGRWSSNVEICAHPVGGGWRTVNRERRRFVPAEVTDKMTHAVAQQLWFEKHRNWGYDPGEPNHRPYFLMAKRVLSRAFSTQEAQGGE